MAERARDMRWWGWGAPGHPPALPAHAHGFLREAVGVGDVLTPPVALADVRLPAPRLSDDDTAALTRACGEGGVRQSHAERVVHAAGKGYVDLVRLRAGTPEDAPDAVAYPASPDAVAALLAACAQRGIAVVPFGGGTSVVGGLAPLRGTHHAVVSLDLRRLDNMGEVDRRSLTVRCQGGLRVADLERRLNAQGLTLGHFPQSYEYVTTGGCAATRSAGQASTGYGRFEKLVLGLRATAPAGEIDLPAVPASAAGPSLREVLVGSEGVLGVITETTLKLRPGPQTRHYEAVFFESFAAGVDALRDLAQHHAAPDVARLSDEAETRLSLALAGSGGATGLLGRAYLRARGYAGGCLAILGFEGDAEEAALRRHRARALMRRSGALPVGRSPAVAWLASRYAGPYLRDDLLTLGVMAETLETATVWSGLIELHRAVAEAIAGALQQRGTPALVACHVSHIYESGASLYFTFLARQQEGQEIEQWRAAKEAASRAISDHGATISHHHAVGRDHAPWLEREVGAEGIEMLRALKEQMDPAGIMNPGKLLV